MHLRDVLICAVLVTAASCANGNKDASAPDDVATAPDEQTGEPEPDPSLTGIVSEEQFKQLHELSGAATPPLRGETIDLAGTQAYLSLPEGASAPLPAVLVIHEWWGLNDHIRHWADRLAADGYAALAVDLYGGEVATDPDGAMALMKQVDQASAAAVLKAGHEFLAADPRVIAERQGVIGWCFGGGWSLRDAIATPELDAAVIYYGHPVMDPEQLDDINAALLGVFANQDESIPPATVDALEQALGGVGKSIELHRYDAVHAFANPSSGRYDQSSATDAWGHVRAFLAAHLKRPQP